MPCYHPLTGWRARDTGNGAPRKVFLGAPDPQHTEYIELPCGQCIGCRLEKSRQWAVRCMHEASLHEENCFITLTYDEPHLPPGGTLRHRDFQLFLKRLRRRIEPRHVLYFHAGEYGESLRRPHHHALLFGYDFEDKQPWTIRNGNPVWRSATLERLWPIGNSELGSVSFESAAYVARYVTKKQTGPSSQQHYSSLDTSTGELHSLRPEYATMSRRPAIGKRWIEKYSNEVFPADTVIARGHQCQPPRYYLDQLKLSALATAKQVVEARMLRRDVQDQTPERLAVREQCTLAQLTLTKRRLEE